MQISIVIVSLHQLVINIHSTFVVTIMESAVCNAHVSSRIMSMGVLAVTFQDCQGSNKVTLLQEVGNIWQFQLSLLFLLYLLGQGLSLSFDSRSGSQHFY